MDKQAILKQLKDIHMPDPIGWWPLAPGWYVVIGLLLVIGGYFLFMTLRHWYALAARRQALVLLREYREQYQTNRNTSELCSQVGALLKRVALVYFPRQSVAGLTDKEWISFLNKTSKDINFNAVKEQLLVTPYNPNSKVDVKPLIKRANQWIKQRRAYV